MIKVSLTCIYLTLILNSMLTAQTERSDHWQMRTKKFSVENKSISMGKVVFLGNSITEGFDLFSAFPEQQPVNRGINGDHIDGVLQRLDSSVIILQPSHLFILLGINDIGRGDSDSLIVTDYIKMLTRLRAGLNDSKIFLISILPASDKWTNCPREQIVRINKKISKLAAEFNCQWLDLHRLFVKDDGYIIDQLSSDGLHLNQAGYDVWATALNNLGIR